MAPTKSARPVLANIAASTRLTMKSKKPLATSTNIVTRQPRVKRKADASPVKETATKRCALGNITNVKVVENKLAQGKNKPTTTNAKKVTVTVKQLPQVKTVLRPIHNENVAPPAAPILRVQTRKAVKNANVINTATTTQKPKESLKETSTKIKTRLSNEFEKTDESLYASALEDVNVSHSSSEGPLTRSKTASAESKSSNVSLVAEQFQLQLNLSINHVPEGVNDFDKENWNDIFQVSHYTMDIFNYLKSREPLFKISDYMDKQVCLTRWMRSLLVDWMVEIQESFELNHETLYLGVKLVDMYLSKVIVSKETLQLVGAAGMFIASKYDERLPPIIDDFLYICDGAYTRKELIRMEFNILKICEFQLGVPLSYRFLRRYARCSKTTMPVLTLARFILEYSLMDYATITLADSKLAAASLYLALQMTNVGGWNKTLEFYSGYKLEQLIDIVYLLNDGLHRKPKEQLMTVRNKYSHKIFFEVAKTPLIKNENLQL